MDRPVAECPRSIPPLRDQTATILLAIIGLTTLVAGALLGVPECKHNRGDPRSAQLELATAIFWVMMALWIFRGHFAASFSLFANLILALATAIFYAVLLWTVYMAMEPYVRFGIGRVLADLLDRDTHRTHSRSHRWPGCFVRPASRWGLRGC